MSGEHVWRCDMPDGREVRVVDSFVEIGDGAFTIGLHRCQRTVFVDGVPVMGEAESEAVMAELRAIDPVFRRIG